MVGGFIARTLAAASEFDVTLVAACQAAARLSTNQADLSDADVVRSVIEPADLVIGAVPGHLGFAVLRTVLEAGRHLVDISFFPEDALELDALARSNGASAIVDCGVMPGLGGMLGARMASELEANGWGVERLSIMVGGLPRQRLWPLEYKAPFSPVDVLEEYTRPARVREHGRVVSYPALSGAELVDLPEVGTLEAFNTDGLRSLLHTLAIPNMVEKTLRYPGHADKLRLLRALGFFDAAPLETSAGAVAPLEVTTRLLDRIWRLEQGEPEFTVMRVSVEAQRAADGGPPEHTAVHCDLLDRTDPATGDSSMARTTGWPAVLAARLVLAGQWERPGVIPAELLGLDDRAWDSMQAGLAAAGIKLTFSTENRGQAAPAVL
jgi:lysine 6-dehydrogenase